MVGKKTRELRASAANGRVDEVRALLAAGADPNAIVGDDCALHGAARFGRVKVIEVLIGAGADIDVLNKDESTPLMIACIAGLAKGSDAALKLIELGANVRYRRKSDGAHALLHAVTRARPAVLTALIEHGAPVDGMKNDPITPLMDAAVQGNLEAVKVLVARGADRSCKCKLPWAKGKTAEEMARDAKRLKVTAFLRA